MTERPIQDLVVNRKARHEFEIFDTFEAGIALLGPEVKSLRAGKGNLQEGYVRIDAEGATLSGCHISPYAQANRAQPDPLRPRRLLLHRTELLKLTRGVMQKGMTIVPLRIYLKGSYVKVEIALAKGKKLHDKRQADREKAARRELRGE